MMRVAHRGLAGLYPENTMIAFEKCLEYDPEAIEMDVQMTKDGELVLLHDLTLDGTSNAGKWSQLLTDEVKKYDEDGNLSNKFVPVTIYSKEDNNYYIEAMEYNYSVLKEISEL